MSDEKETTMTEDLEAAFEAAEEVEEVSAVEEEPQIEADLGPERDEKGQFKAKEEEPEVVEVETEEAPPAEEVVEEVVAGKAPDSWKPAAREAWADIPEGARAEIERREKEISAGLQSAAEKSKLGDTFLEAAQPYQALMAADGVTDPVAGAQNLFQTYATLKMGQPIQKAQVVADMIKHHGIDIATLDSLIVGESVSDATGSVQDQVQQAMQPFMQQMQEVPRQQEKARMQSELGEFAKGKEFFNDVHIDMADLMDLAANRGQAMTMQQAYDKACQINPEVQSALEVRKTQKAAEDMRRKQAASTSISGAPNGSGQAIGQGSLADTIANAWDQSMGQG